MAAQINTGFDTYVSPHRVAHELGERARKFVDEQTAVIVRQAEEKMIEATGMVAGAKAVTERLLDRIVALELENARLRRGE
jgi:hypothetical protein